MFFNGSQITCPGRGLGASVPLNNPRSSAGRTWVEIMAKGGFGGRFFL